MLEQPEDQKLEARLVFVAKDVLGPRKPSERLCASEQRGGQSGCVAAQPWREMRRAYLLGRRRVGDPLLQ